MHGNDVRVIEVGDGAGFAQVGFGGFGAIHQPAMQNLDCDKTPQLLVVGKVDDAEPALTEDSRDAVATDLVR